MMWFMNRLINPLVSLILTSPLHGLLSGSVLILIYRGRKSGKEYQLPVQYAQEGTLVYILPGAPEQKTWWRNMRDGQPVRLIVRGHTLAGQAELLQGEQDVKAITHALGTIFRRFPAAAGMAKIHAASGGTYAVEDLLQAARSTTVVRVKLDQDSHPATSEHP